MEETDNVNNKIRELMEDLAIFDWYKRRWIYSSHGHIPDWNHMIGMRNALSVREINVNSRMHGYERTK